MGKVNPAETPNEPPSCVRSWPPDRDPLEPPRRHQANCLLVIAGMLQPCCSSPSRNPHAYARFAFLLGTSMKKAKAPRVPVLEDAFELNLPKLMRTANAIGASRLVLDDGDVRTVVVLTQDRVAIFLGGRTWMVDIVAVSCLDDRVRLCLKCPRAHEGNFQSLYFWGGELACRHCHRLRYRSNLAASAADRARIARSKLLSSMGGAPGQLVAERQPFKWRSRHARLSARLARLTGVHYRDVRAWLERQDTGRRALSRSSRRGA